MMFLLASLLFLLASVPTRADVGLDAVVGQFSPNRPHWHEYSAKTLKLCSRKQNAKCTAELVRKVFLRNVMPCQDPANPAQNGAVLVPFMPFPDPSAPPGAPSLCTYSPGHVRIGIHDNGMSVTIHTEPDHRLYDGVVIRKVVETSPGEFELRTRGVGNNRSDLWAAANKEMGPLIFLQQNDRLLEYLNTCLASRCDN